MATKVSKQDELTKELAVELHRGSVESIDLTELRESFNACRHMMTDGITLPIHELVYEQDYLAQNSKVISKFINHLYSHHRELNIETVVGKLAVKLPFPKNFFGEGRKYTNFARKQASYVLAAIITEILVDGGILKLDARVVYHGGKPKTMTYVLLGSSDSETDLLAGYDLEPGQTKITHTSNGFRVKKVVKAILEELATMPFKISDVFDEELLIHGYRLSAAYNAPSENEKDIKRQYRFEHTYRDAWLELKSRDQFYLPVYPDGRLRFYYTANVLYGARPQGKLWETLAIDRAEPKLLDRTAYHHIVHIIMTILFGKMSVTDAVGAFRQHHHQQALTIDPMAVEVPDVAYPGNEGAFRLAENEFGERILLNKCAQALQMYYDQIPCPYLFGKDLTNSGLIIAGNSFRAQKMLEGANCMGSNVVADSHMQFGKAHGVADILSRGQIKDIHTPLLHGSTVNTIVSKLQLYVEDTDSITAKAVQEHNVEAYGHEVNNIEQIAAFGYNVVNNHVNKLSWKLPDGEVAHHESLMEHTPFKVYAVSNRKKGKHYHAYSLIQTMPLAVDERGHNAFSAELGVNTKRRGLFANITHSLDAYVLRRLVRQLLDSNEVFLLKHDDFMVSPDAFGLVIKSLQSSFDHLQHYNLYQSALDQIADANGVEAPRLITGDAPNKTKESVNFLMV